MCVCVCKRFCTFLSDVEYHNYEKRMKLCSRTYALVCLY